MDTRHAWEAKKASKDNLRSVEDQDVKSIVEEQISLGFHAITDGEYRRHMFWGSFWPGLEGMKEEDTPDPDLFRMYIPDIAAFTEAGYKPGETVICTGKIKHVGSTYTDQFDYLKSLVPKEKAGDLKLTLAAPNWYHLVSPFGSHALAQRVPYLPRCHIFPFRRAVLLRQQAFESENHRDMILVYSSGTYCAIRLANILLPEVQGGKSLPEGSVCRR